MKDAKDDIQILFRKSKERDSKVDLDWKWLFGANISICGLELTLVGMRIAIINLLIK